MSGYSEVLQTMLAMALVSFLVMNANRAILTNNVVMVEGELEEQVIAIAQDYIDESRATTYDENTVSGSVPVSIPGGFSTIGPETGETTRASFDDFDDYDGWTETITASGGIEFDVSIDVSYYDADSETTINTTSTLKLMEITISSDALSRNNNVNSYSFKFLRSFYAD